MPPTTSTSGWPATSRPGSTADPTGSPPTTCSGSARPPPPWPSSPCASRSSARSTSAPAAASRRFTWRRTRSTVVATDVNQRALRLTRFNAELNEVADRIEVRDGSFFEPVAGELFDLVATNPPFVISPATGERLVYRDSGLPGDRVVEHIVRGIPDVLADGGTGQVLANWMIHRDRPWDERLAEWIVGLRRLGRAARGRGPADVRRAVAQGRRSARRGRTTSSATTPGCPGSTTRARRRSASAGSTCGRPTRRPSYASRTGRTTSSSPSHPR